MKENLIAATTYLLRLQEPIEPIGSWRDHTRTMRHFGNAFSQLRTALSIGERSYLDGLYAKDTALPENEHYSEPKLLQAIQSIYTTKSAPPKVLPGMILRGFWRITLCKESHSVVEHGYPGPRMMKCKPSVWDALSKHHYQTTLNGDSYFKNFSKQELPILQKLVDFGYLVPDEY